MKRYLIITASGHNYEVQAETIKQARKHGAIRCKRMGLEFIGCKLIRS